MRKSHSPGRFFDIPEKRPEKIQALEALRQQLIEPIQALRHDLQNTTGKKAAERLFNFILDQGIYEKLLAREDAYAQAGDELAIDRNRQVWTSINDLLDQFALFFDEDPVPLDDFCSMLEASLAAKTIRSLPQKTSAVAVAPPEMLFSSGIRCMAVMGLQENELSARVSVLSENEKNQLEELIQSMNRAFFDEMKGVPLTVQDIRSAPTGLCSRPPPPLSAWPGL